MLYRVVFAKRNLRVRHGGRIVKEAKTEPGGEETDEGLVELRFLDQSVFDGIGEVRVLGTAARVGAGTYGDDGGVLEVRGELVADRDVCDGPAIAGDVAVELPGPAQGVLQEHGVGTRGLAIERVIGAHRAPGMVIGDRGAEGWKVGVLKVVRRGLHVCRVPSIFWARVYGEMFGGGNRPEEAGVVPLQAGDEGYTHTCGEEGVFAIGLLPASPARVSEDVDVRRP